MEHKRKPIMIDRDLVDTLALYAKRYGMSLTAYLRRLFRSAINAEMQGVHAPQALSRGIMMLTLSRLSLVPLPLRLIEKYSEKELKALAAKTGPLLGNLGIDSFELISLIVDASGIGFTTPSNIRLLYLAHDPLLSKLAVYLEELAKTSGLPVEKHSNTSTIIHRPQSKTEKRETQ